MNLQDDIPSLPIYNFKDHYVLLFDLTSMEDATENCHYSELVGETLRLELNFTFPLEHVTKHIVLCERMSLVAVDKFGVVGKKSKLDSISLQQIINRILLLKYRYLGCFLFDHVPTLDVDIFAIIKAQPSNIQGDHWRMMRSFPMNCIRSLSWT